MSDEEVPWLGAEERAAWLATVGMLVRLPAVLDAQLQADAGLSFFEYMVLAGLSESPGRTLQMSDIARFSSSSLSRLSHTARRLESQGLIERTQQPGAGRRTNATLTDAGYAKIAAAAPAHVRAVRRLLVDAVTPEQLAALREISEAVLHRIDPDAPCPTAQS